MPRRIATHRPEYIPSVQAGARDYRRAPARIELEAFYNGRMWRALSRAFKIENPLCAECKRHRRITAATQVHHIKDVKSHPELAYDWENLESLCVACHNAMRHKGVDH